jgi:hypothetical protein
MTTRDEQRIMVLDGVVAQNELCLNVDCYPHSGMSRSGLYLMSTAFNILSRSLMPEHSEVCLMKLPNYIAPVPAYQCS